MAVGGGWTSGQHSKCHFNGPSVPTGKEEISSVSTEALPSRRGRGMGREREREVWNTTVGDHQLEEGVLTKAKEGAKKSLKARMVQVHK